MYPGLVMLGGEAPDLAVVHRSHLQCPVSTESIPIAEPSNESEAGDCHNFLNGPPFLRCSCPHLIMQHQLQRPAEVDVWVDWGAQRDCGGTRSQFQHAPSSELAACSLSVRGMGRELVRVNGVCLRPLRLSFVPGATTAGSAFIAELCWQGGRRCLHILAPPHHGIPLDGLLLPPGRRPLGQQELQASITTAEAHAPPLPAATAQLERGFGLELELLTEAMDLPAVVADLAHRLSPRATAATAAAAAARLDDDGPPAAAPAPEPAHLLLDALRRCGRWRHEIDESIRPSSLALSSSVLAATACLLEEEPEEGAETRARCLRMLRCQGETMKSELQSPSPPNELRWSRGAALELGALVHGMLAFTGAAAAPAAASGRACTALHVHVNVRCPTSGGALLSALQLLDVVFAWIRFDGVTQRFARPWMWCEPSCMPLYATGREEGLEETPGYVSGHASGEALRGEEGEDGEEEGEQHPWQRYEHAPQRTLYDVPRFVREAFAVVHSDDFQALPEAEKVERLFGDGMSGTSPGDHLGHYCSLNVDAIAKHGTLEFRRFHSTLDAPLMVRWAHFCTCFVEAFAVRGDAGKRSQPRLTDLPSASAAVRELQAAQEMATAEQLMNYMAGLVHPTTAEYFARIACR